MNKILGLMIFLSFTYSVFSQDEPIEKPVKNKSSVEMGKRYIKLGFSWIGSGNYDNAEKYLYKGISIVKNYGNKYWEAVGYEFYGYLNLAKNNKQAALDYFTTAQTLYKKYGNLSNGEGSNEALASLIESVKNDEVTMVSNTGNSSTNSEKYDRLLTKYNQVVQERDDLKFALNELKREISELKKMNRQLSAKVDECLASSTSKPPDENPVPSDVGTSQKLSTGTTPWDASDEPSSSNNKVLVLQAGAGNVFNFEVKSKFGGAELGGFLISQRNINIIYGGILSYEVYKGKNWDAPFDLTVGYSTTGVGPYIDGYAGIRYYFLDNAGVYAKAGYNMAYVANLIQDSYMNFSVGFIFRK
jgi:tetratricopeptide (TPR) repeat protein